MMGGPIDARRSPTAVNDLATSQSLRWFETNVIHDVPDHYPGRGPPRLSRLPAARRLHGDEPASATSARTGTSTSTWSRATSTSADAHRRFYDEYNAVLDMPAEYYLDTIRIVFQEHLLPRGLWTVGGERVAPEAITRTALLTIEGELDDISGLGQTRAAHDLCTASRPRASATSPSKAPATTASSAAAAGARPSIRRCAISSGPARRDCRSGSDQKRVGATC